MRNYAELQASSNFSFLRGASHPHELVAAAHEYGYHAIAVTDRNTLSGIVLAHSTMITPEELREVETAAPSATAKPWPSGCAIWR